MDVLGNIARYKSHKDKDEDKQRKGAAMTTKSRWPDV